MSWGVESRSNEEPFDEMKRNSLFLALEGIGSNKTRNVNERLRVTKEFGSDGVPTTPTTGGRIVQGNCSERLGKSVRGARRKSGCGGFVERQRGFGGSRTSQVRRGWRNDRRIASFAD